MTVSIHSYVNSIQASRQLAFDSALDTFVKKKRIRVLIFISL